MTKSLKNKTNLKLVCNKNTKTLGIVLKDSSFNMLKFREHIETCPACEKFVAKVMDTVFTPTAVGVITGLMGSKRG